MHCYTHTNRTAGAICVNCGTALCADCTNKTDVRKNVCSSDCAASSMAMDRAINAIGARVRRSSKATAWFCWSLGVIFGVFGVFSIPTDMFFAVYLLAPCLVFIFIGFWYNNIEKRAI